MNKLASETSPYLLQHAENPVDWYPWGDEALKRAKKEKRPILLSVGYSACHWCHVMERECFENEAIAKRMNESFVNIKVDREERPDVDAFYMQAVLAMTGGGGWPMTVFLTPEGQAFYAGTYFPPTPRQGMQSFPQVLEMVAEGWAKNRDEVYNSASGLVEHLEEERKRPPFDEELNDQLRRDAREVLNLRVDPRWGGWGSAPKFPSPSTLEFLMRRGSLDPVALTLDRMAEGGMYDLVGGGFHRYSIDERWLVPHFEKMLYDNAQLATTYLHGYVTLGTERYRDVVAETVDYMLRELQLESGGFASSQDADTDGIEGLTYTWARGEGAPEELMHIFEGGRFILRGELAPDLRDELFAIREQRPKPPLDDKAVAGWNGLTLAAVAECGRVLDRADWVEAARRTGEFLLGPMSMKDGRLYRTWRDGTAKGDGFAEDYAFVANGLVELHVATGELRWLEEANRLARLAIELFADEDNGGFYQASAGGEELPVRMKLYDDVPTPSANSMLAYVLLRLGRIYGDDELVTRAEGAMKMVSRALLNAADSFGWMLVTLDLYLQPPREVAIIGPPDSDIARAALGPWQPTSVFVFGPGEGVPLLEGRDFVDGKPAVYICERFACQAPVTDPAELPPPPDVGLARED